MPTPKDISGIEVDRRSVLWQILKQWRRTNIHVAEAWEGEDAPWWYNERASLSILAGAVWLSGGIAFEEFSAEKLFASRRGAYRRPYSGRCDMFFEKGSCEFNIEAKFGYSGATNEGTDPVPRIEKVIKSAKKAARDLPANGQRRLAVVFIAPYFTRKFEDDDVRMIIRWIDKIREIKCSAKAWVFPKSSRRLLSEDADDYCPGAAVFIQEVWRASGNR